MAHSLVFSVSFLTVHMPFSNFYIFYFLKFCQGNRTNFNRLKETEGTIPYFQEAVGIVPNSEIESSLSSNFHPSKSQIPSQTMDTASMNSVHVQASEYEDAESGMFILAKYGSIFNK